MYVSMYVCMYVCMFVCMYVCMLYVRMYLYICIYVCIQTVFIEEDMGHQRRLWYYGYLRITTTMVLWIPPHFDGSG